jgi:hypothetical protein
MRRYGAALLLGMGLFSFAAGEVEGAGLACLQSCSGSACSQVFCGPATGSGFCECMSGALPWAATGTFAAYCTTSTPLSTNNCAPPSPPGVSPSTKLPNATVMNLALMNQNPFVAALVRALQRDAGWVTGPVEGVIHDSQYDSATARTSHEPAIAFAGQVTQIGSDSSQLDIVVAGDISQLRWMKRYSDSFGAEPPRSIHGTVSGGGTHGSLQVLAATGAAQILQW